MGDTRMVKNLFRDLSMSGVRGYDELSEQEKDIFDAVYKRHVASMNQKRRFYFSENHIEEVQTNSGDIAVYFNNGHCFKYKKNRTWKKFDKNKST